MKTITKHPSNSATKSTTPPPQQRGTILRGPTILSEPNKHLTSVRSVLASSSRSSTSCVSSCARGARASRDEHHCCRRTPKPERAREMDGMDAPVYSLLVCVGNETHKLFGNREDLESVLDRWVAGELVTKVKVIGFCNTADRARRVFAFDPEAVIVMSLAMEF